MLETKFWKGGLSISVSCGSEALHPGCFSLHCGRQQSCVQQMPARGTQGQTGFEFQKRSQTRAKAREHPGTQVSCLCLQVPLRNPRVSNGGRPNVGSDIPHGDTPSGLSQRRPDRSRHAAPDTSQWGSETPMIFLLSTALLLLASCLGLAGTHHTLEGAQTLRLHWEG